MGYYLSASICLGVQLFDEGANYFLDDVIVNGKTPDSWSDLAEYIEYDDTSPFCGKVEAIYCGFEGQNGIILAVKDTTYEINLGQVKSLNSELLNMKEKQWEVIFELNTYLKKCGITPCNQGILLSAYYG